MSDERELRDALEAAQARIKALEGERRRAEPEREDQPTLVQLRTELTVLRRTQAEAVAREANALRRIRELQEEPGTPRQVPVASDSRPGRPPPSPEIRGALEQERKRHAVTRAALEATQEKLHAARAQVIELENTLNSNSSSFAFLVLRALRHEPDDVTELRAIIASQRARIAALEAKAAAPNG